MICYGNVVDSSHQYILTMSYVVDAVNVCLSILVIKVHPLTTHYLEGKKTGVVDTQVGSTVVKREQTESGTSKDWVKEVRA